MNKSFLSNLIAALLLIASYFSPIYPELLFSIGAFALSGALTNCLAVHMLFEKIPGLYGSGVIPNRFEEFKAAIKGLIIEQFFTQAQIDKFLTDEMDMVDKISVDQDKVFAMLVEAIMSSSFGGMLGMLGGVSALEPLKEPISKKIDDIVTDIKQQLDTHSLSETLRSKVEAIVDSRLEELTPEKVKEMVQGMIRQHLGWLVVWGGIFGGLIGGLVYFVNYLPMK